LSTHRARRPRSGSMLQGSSHSQLLAGLQSHVYKNLVIRRTNHVQYKMFWCAGPRLCP
jgi:hypothetical protein